MTVRLEDAARSASDQGKTHYAFPSVDAIGPDDLFIITVTPDDKDGWRLNTYQGRYDGNVAAQRSGKPDKRITAHMSNMVFHETDAEMADGITTVEAVRRLEGYEEGVVLHPQAAKTVVRARVMEDRKVPIRRAASFIRIMTAANLIGIALILTNMLCALMLALTWGHMPPEVVEVVTAAVLTSLAILCATPFLLRTMIRENRLFINPVARKRGHAATMRIAQLAIVLTIVALGNGLMVAS